MNKIRVRVIMTQNKDIHIQVSTDNQVWFSVMILPPINLEPQGLDAIAHAKNLWEVVSNSHALATHILWKAEP